jgi:putative DNA primase/helicase
MISKDIACEEGFAQNIPYVNCLNGVVDIHAGGVLIAHSSDFRFRHCIRAKYDPNAECPRFLEYVEYISGGDKELRKLLRVILGYIFSHYHNAKLAVLLYGIPHTGKSVLCNLISRIIGEDYVTNVDIAMLHRQEYAAELANAILNVAPDLKNEPLKDVGFFKSLISKDDVIMTRSLYQNPIKIHCQTKMLFSSNHLISFSSDVDPFDMEAVFNRLLFFPFQNPPIKDSENDKHLSEKLFEERDGIFTWAMGGLKYYVEHNENFPECALSAEIKAKNIAQFCPEKIFFSEAIKYEEGRYESSSAIKAAFEAFCFDIGAKTKGNIHGYLEEHEQISKVKKRVTPDGYLSNTGNPIYVYRDIRLKEKYRNKERGYDQ